jgi:NADPH-dependent glutamate synthase beta subunit-like oxidoreductase
MHIESLEEAVLGRTPDSRTIGRRTELLKNECLHVENDDHYQEILADDSHRKIFLRYCLSPEKVIDRNNVVFSKTKLTGDSFQQRAIDTNPKESVTLKSDLWIKSVGYKTIPMPGVPFDNKTFTIPNDQGCVLTDNGEIIKGLYVCGWAKRGARGIIDATLRDAFETFTKIKLHLEEDLLNDRHQSAKNTLYNIDK